MSDILPFFAFVLAILLAIYGVWRKKRWFCVAGGVLSLPMAWYLTTTSDFGLAAWLIPLGMFLSEWSLRQGRNRLAWLGLLPAMVTLVVLVLAIVAFASLGSL